MCEASVCVGAGFSDRGIYEETSFLFFVKILDIIRESCEMQTNIKRKVHGEAIVCI